MTLTDGEDMKTSKTDNKMNIGGALRDVLVEALPEGRLTFGVYESSKMLEMNPDGVMLCVLPENSADDVTLHIHFTLIEAYCWENDIRVIKVDESEKLCKLLSTPNRPPLNDNDVQSNRMSSLTFSDFNCILLEYPTTQCSSTEEDVMEFCKLTSDVSPSPIVDLAV